ncbi:hypothetical protein EW026_g7931 [Hermanssonia centrifuga]|uniref:Uncharacterized protein n=1 Tax=Hermanssonia centrifuga TaxID=98765 RepID=A0A4S4K680_9APHY|nr:hypothetical protein EW026_g7931 [Hermanssonia centrifuga]
MSLKPFTGAFRKLVLAFDVGTTYSGIGYAILDPGEVPRIQGVTRFPGQENGDFKIPTILWYSQDGTVRAAGAEARDPGMALLAEDEELVFTEWFKLHLRPDSMQDDSNLKRTPLPLGKTVIEVFETHPNGDSLWNSVEGRIEFILSHPNGWEGSQQGKMRQATIAAGLIPDNAAGHARIHFVTEGEASMHYCVDNGLATGAITDGQSVVIIDAGGGTVDLSTYVFTTMTPMTVEEIAPPDCILQGSTRVNIRAEAFLRSKLGSSRYSNDEDVKSMLEAFEKSAKPTFKDVKDRSFIKFGSMRDRDADFGIRSGQLTIEGTDVAQFFEPSIQAIIGSVRKQYQASSITPQQMAFLVGGFAASPWLFYRLKDILSTMGLQLSRPDNHTIICYRGGLKQPKWTDKEKDLFSTLCTIRADTSRVVKYKRQGTRGNYFQQDYKILLLCGLTEMKAQLSWIEQGVEKRGPAEIVYDDDPSAVC